MRQVRVSVKRRPRHTASADAPTVNRKIARIWFPESQQPASGESGS